MKKLDKPYNLPQEMDMQDSMMCWHDLARYYCCQISPKTSQLEVHTLCYLPLRKKSI